MVSQAALVRAELLKHRSTRTSLGLFAAMLALVLLVVLLHGLGLPADRLAERPAQLTELIGRGEMFGVLFAALLGAMSVTTEFRHGTVRPTFLVSPRRGHVVLAKVWAGMSLGIAFGVAAQVIAAVIGNAALSARGVDVHLDTGDYALLIGGAALAAAFWAAIGVGLGALVRAQVPAVVGICVWILFVEGLLLGDVGLGNIGHFTPGALGRAASGQDSTVVPALAVVLLALYAVAATALGCIAISRRDVD